MEYKGSLLYSQQPATCVYHEPNESSPNTPIHLYIFLPSIPKFSKWSFIIMFSYKYPVCIFLLPILKHDLPISPSWMWPPKYVLSKVTEGPALGQIFGLVKQLWNSELSFLHTFIHIPWVQKSVRTTVGCKIQHKIQNKSTIKSTIKLNVPLNSYTYNS